jgi:hypothetical protein
LECEGPNKDIFDFRGILKMENKEKSQISDPGSEHSCLLGITQFIPRGATLKNSVKSYALVVYTGTDTKLARNEGVYRSKISNISYQLNIFFAGNLLVMGLMAFFMS